jgi:hypothetical protein
MNLISKHMLSTLLEKVGRSLLIFGQHAFHVIDESMLLFGVRSEKK